MKKFEKDLGDYKVLKYFDKEPPFHSYEINIIKKSDSISGHISSSKMLPSDVNVIFDTDPFDITLYIPECILKLVRN